MSGAIKINGTSSGSTTITAPATGGDESIELSTALAAKGDVTGETWTGTHDFTGATVTGAGGGKVLQVIAANYATPTATTSTSFVDTGLSASITPSATSSKVLVIITQSAVTNRTSSFTAAGVFQILRDATGLFVGQGEQCGIYVQASSQDLGWRGVVSMVYLDSPSTTSATTYKSQMRANNAGHSVTAQSLNNPSSIVLMEIAA